MYSMDAQETFGYLNLNDLPLIYPEANVGWWWLFFPFNTKQHFSMASSSLGSSSNGFCHSTLPRAQRSPSQVNTTAAARLNRHESTHTQLSLLSWIHALMKIQRGICPQSSPALACKGHMSTDMRVYGMRKGEKTSVGRRQGDHKANMYMANACSSCLARGV